MATKKPAAKSAVKKPAAKTAPAKKATVKSEAKTPAVKPISKTNPPAAKTAVVSKAKVAEMAKSNIETAVKKTGSDTKGYKETTLAKQAKFAAKREESLKQAPAATPAPVAKAAERVKDKVAQIANDQSKVAPKPTQPVKKAALVAPAPKPAGQQQQQRHHHKHQKKHQHRSHGKGAPAPAVPTATEIWNRGLGVTPKPASVPAAPVAMTPNEEIKALLRRPIVQTGDAVVQNERPALPPAAPKEQHRSAPGSMSVSDMNAVIAARGAQVAQPAFDIKSLPFKTRP